MARIFPKLLGVLIAAFGVFIMGCWWFDQSILKSFNPNFIVMVFNTALCFTLSGIALVLPESRPVLRRKGQIAVGCIIALISALVLWQDITNTYSGIDQLFATVWVHDYNPHPGRISPPTSICFILSGMVFALLNMRRGRWANIVTQILILTVLTLSIIGITAASIRLELLYEWYKYGRMAIASAICFLMLAATLWILWYLQELREGGYLDREDKRISVTGILIICIVAMSAGMSGFGILAEQMERTLEAGLKETYDSHAQLVRNEIDLRISNALPVTTRLLLNRYLAVFNVTPGDEAARLIIEEDARSFLNHDTFAIAIYANSGARVTQLGEFTQHPSLTVPIAAPEVQKATLLWKDGTILRLEMAIAHKGERIGTAIMEVRLAYLGALLLSRDSLGESAETRICHALSGAEMQCLPSHNHPGISKPEPRIRKQEVLSMDLALRNQSGVRVFRDYRNEQVISAYGPVGDAGLGMVVKINTAEFYGPIRQRLQYAVAILMLLSIAGITVQRLQLVPLVQRLVNSEERLALAWRGAGDGMWDWNIRTNEIILSDRLKELMGYGPDELTHRMSIREEHMHPDDKKHAMDALQAHLNDRVPYDVEYRLKTKASEWKWFNARGQASWDAQGKPIRMAGSLSDISQRKEVERMKNEFISTVSHELRTPLTSIRGSLGLMKSGVVGNLPPKAGEMTEIAYKNCERLILLINDILDLEKIESGGMRFDPKEENLNHLVHQAVEANAGYGEKFEVRFAVNTLDPPAYVKVDGGRLIQVLANLLSNAAKFSNPGDVVHIRIARRNEDVIVSIADRGPGIPEEFHARIFQKFAQADSSSSRPISGTGLGLNISKQIMERMGGAIGFASKAGEGTTFWISLPEIRQQNLSSQWDEAVAYLNADNFCSLPRILHAEDDYGLCRIISHSLQGRAIMHMASTVADASKLLNANAYDLLILDLALPDGTGLRLLQQIQDQKLPTEVMILSATEVEENIRSKVALALVKSTISEDKIIESILKLVRHEPAS